MTDPAKRNNSKEFIVCHNCYFSDGSKFQNCICNGFHDLKILCLNLSDIAIITVKDFDYYWIIYNISKSEAIDLLKYSVIDDRGYI